MKLMRKMVPVIIWIIVISFALWGVENIFISLQEESKGVGKIFGKTVSFKQFQDALKTAELFSQKPSGEKISIEELEDSAWQNIVLGFQAKREKIAVTDAEVKSEIERLFTSDGSSFNPEFYKTWVLKTSGESPRLFEERIRETLRIRSLIKQHQDLNITVSDQELAQVIEYQNTQITAQAIRFDNLQDAEQVYSELTKPENWDTKKAEPASAIKTLGPLSLDIFTAMMGIEKNDTKLIGELPVNGFSKPIKTGDGVSVFRLIDKKISPSEDLGQAEKEERKKQLAERRKQELFFDWWQNLMREANIQKFSKPNSAPEAVPSD